MRKDEFKTDKCSKKAQYARNYYRKHKEKLREYNRNRYLQK